MEIKGKLIETGDITTGESNRGKWKRSFFLLLIDERYEKKLAIIVFGELVDYIHQKCKLGDQLTCQVDVTSKLFENKYYTDAQAWKILGGSKTAPEPQNNQSAGSGEPTFDDDLPF